MFILNFNVILYLNWFLLFFVILDFVFYFILTLIWVGFLGVRFEVGRGGTTPPPPPRLKVVRIMLESWNLARNYTAICSFRKYTFQYQGLLNFPDVTIFFQNSAFFGQNSTFGQYSTFTQSNSVRAVLEIF